MSFYSNLHNEQTICNLQFHMCFVIYFMNVLAEHRITLYILLSLFFFKIIILMALIAFAANVLYKPLLPYDYTYILNRHQ